MQKQKYNTSQILQNYFYHLPQHQQFKIKSLPSKYLLYRKNDQVIQLYIFIQGKIKMSIDNKQIILTPPLLIGDYEPINQIYKRITDIKIIKKSKFIVVPIELLFNLKLESKIIIQNIVAFKSRALRYLFEKSLIITTCRKSDTIQLQKKIVFIVEGVFQLSKFITLANFKKHNLQMKKNFDIIQFHPYQIVFDKNLTCLSEKGTLFSIQEKYYQVLSYYYEEFKNFYEEIVASQSLYQSQVEQIKKVYKHEKKLTQSFVPYIIAKQQENIRKQLDLISPKSFSTIIKTPKIKSLSQQKYIDPTKQTFIQFLDKQEKQKLKIKPKKNQQRSNTQDLTMLRKQRLQTISNKISMQKMKRRKNQLQIPQHFMETKFKMRMFLKAKATFQSGGFRNPAEKRYSLQLNKSISPRKSLLLQIQSRNK